MLKRLNHVMMLIIIASTILLITGCKDKNTVYPADGNEFVFAIAVNNSVVKYTYADYYKIDNKKYYQLYDSTDKLIGQIGRSLDSTQLSIIEIDKFNH